MLIPFNPHFHKIKLEHTGVDVILFITPLICKIKQRFTVQKLMMSINVTIKEEISSELYEHDNFTMVTLT